jgi:hypothetical protein
MQILQWIEQTGLSTWVRESDALYGYPLILTFHALGMGLLVGVNLFISLRILGIAPGLSLAEMETFLPLLWAGLSINAVTGALLLVADATRKLTSPVFYIKMVCIFSAIAIVVKTRNTVLRRPDTAISITGKMLASISLFLWVSAITAGRLMAYIGPSGLTKKP